MAKSQHISSTFLPQGGNPVQGFHRDPPEEQKPNERKKKVMSKSKVVNKGGNSRGVSKINNDRRFIADSQGYGGESTKPGVGVTVDDAKTLTPNMMKIMANQGNVLTLPKEEQTPTFSTVPKQRSISPQSGNPMRFAPGRNFKIEHPEAPALDVARAILGLTGKQGGVTGNSEYDWVQMIRNWIYWELTANVKMVVEDSYAELPEVMSGNITRGQTFAALAHTYRDMAKEMMRARLMLWRSDMVLPQDSTINAFTGVTVTEEDVNIPPMLWIFENPPNVNMDDTIDFRHGNLTSEDQIIGYFICPTEAMPTGNILKYLHGNPEVHIFTLVLRGEKAGNQGLWMRYGTEGLEKNQPCSVPASWFLGSMRFVKMKIVVQEKKENSKRERKQELREWNRKAPNLFVEAPPYYVVTLREAEVPEDDSPKGEKQWSCHWLVGGKLGFWRRGRTMPDGKVLPPNYVPPHWKGDMSKPAHVCANPQGIRSVYDVKR